MAEIQFDPAVNGPGTHALVIGVSDYPYVDGPRTTPNGARYGLQILTSAARSAAEVAWWLLRNYHNPDAPLASLRVLLSPAEGETIPRQLKARLPGPCPATVDAVKKDLVALKALCEQQPANVAFVYVAGHGIQLTKRGAIVLLEDFAGPNQAAQLEGAIDMLGCHNGFRGDGFASRQVWFVDACRQLPAVAAQFEKMVGALTLDEPVGDVESSALYLASSTRELAFAKKGGKTLFSTALLDALGGAGAKGPDPLCPDWHVSVYGLGQLLGPTVKRLAGLGGADQHVDVTGRVNDATIHRFKKPPNVRLQLNLDPVAAAANAKASLYYNGQKAVVNGSTTWPLVKSVKAGLYTLDVEVLAPYQSIERWPISVSPPPEVSCRLEVG